MTEKLLFLGTKLDIPYIPRLKSMIGTAHVSISTTEVVTLIDIILLCKKHSITGVLTTSVPLLKKLLLREHEVKNPSLDNYAGSYFKYQDIEFVFLSPLEHLQTVPYGKFVAQRYISKLTTPAKWKEVPEFEWCMLDATNADAIFDIYTTAYAIAVDIETFSNPPSIRCIGYTAIFIEGSTITTHSCVLPVDSMWAVVMMRKFNWELKAPKIFQNGKYDISYLSRYNAVPFAYYWDTAHLFHSWYSELPKDLAFLGAYFVRKAMYWKDLAETNDLQEYYRYNALDTWTTANVWIAILLEAPQWARKNYTLEFPLVFPCHLSEMTGIKRDMVALSVAKQEVTKKIEEHNLALQRMTDTPGFNSNSYIQVRALAKILGCGTVTESDEAALEKFKALHPLNSRIFSRILELRGDRKLSSTYLRTDADITKTSKGGAKEFAGNRILYSLNPHGTDTGRLASREHHFWCGLQIQNIPRGKLVKQTIIADEGFLFAESDLEQAESRDTAHIAGEEAMIAAVSGTNDFHSVNASAFFGVPYEAIFDNATRKQLDVELRDLSKRTNHGANYNMGPNILVRTMGEKKVWEAKRLLKLPNSYSLKQVAEHLLAQFHRTYPNMKGLYYPKVIADVSTTKMLVGATGWTRYCFGEPGKNKLDLNALVAHCPQSLNAMTLNKAYLAVFMKIAMNPEHKDNFKLCAQIHDSILFQYRIGHEYICDMVKTEMEIPVTVKGADGKVREFIVPAAVKKGGSHWSTCK